MKRTNAKVRLVPGRPKDFLLLFLCHKQLSLAKRYFTRGQRLVVARKSKRKSCWPSRNYISKKWFPSHCPQGIISERERRWDSGNRKPFLYWRCNGQRRAWTWGPTTWSHACQEKYSCRRRRLLHVVGQVQPPDGDTNYWWLEERIRLARNKSSHESSLIFLSSFTTRYNLYAEGHAVPGKRRGFSPQGFLFVSLSRLFVWEKG